MQFLACSAPDQQHSAISTLLLRTPHRPTWACARTLTERGERRESSRHGGARGRWGSKEMIGLNSPPLSPGPTWPQGASVVPSFASPYQVSHPVSLMSPPSRAVTHRPVGLERCNLPLLLSSRVDTLPVWPRCLKLLAEGLRVSKVTALPSWYDFPPHDFPSEVILEMESQPAGRPAGRSLVAEGVAEDNTGTSHHPTNLPTDIYSALQTC